ncbi:DUF3352 domain-containing protein [Leeuwenhoekiella sp. A16]|uniref:DUF3352 domain-containing protein n=1 Tax=unclassified Leeuwenhoekiella TaxID=2615029 RepID=UPI003A7FD9F7
MKYYLALIVLLFLLIGCDQNPVNQSSLIPFIPRNSSVILKVNKWTDFQNALNNNALLSKFVKSELYNVIQEKSSNFNLINPKSEVLISFVSLGKNEYDISLVTENSSSLFKQDSVLQSSIKQVEYNDNTISSYTKGENTLYFTTIESTFLASTSRLLIENKIREEKSETVFDADFQKLYKTGINSATVNMYVRGSDAQQLSRNILGSASPKLIGAAFKWAALDFDIATSSIEINGVITYDETLKNRLALLKDTKRTTSQIANVVPAEATAATSFSYKNLGSYIKNLAKLRQIQPKDFALYLNDLYSNSDEIGIISLKAGNALAIHTTDIELAKESLLAASNEAETYRDIIINTFNDSLAIQKDFKELLAPPSLPFYSAINDFLIFAEDQDILKTVIANIQNKTTLDERENFRTIIEKVSNEQSLLFFANSEKLKEKMTVKGSTDLKNDLKEIDLSLYPFVVAQLIEEDDFLHFNALIEQNSVKPDAGAVSQIASVKLAADLAISPQLVNNHRTKGMDVAVQDVNHVLYLIDNNGKILWQKQLASKILGKISQVDLYKNGRLQLAFTTSDTFYILDRNGNEVAPFPLKFNDDITQPLSVFDYDNNRNYRFVVTQGKNLLMYDSRAAIVNGFKFTSAKSEIILPPKHIRIGTKDYITIQQQNGTLNILDRTGDERVPVELKFNFSQYPVAEANTGFELVDKDGVQFHIDQKGKVTKKDKNLTDGFAVAQLNNTQAIIDNNRLIVNNKENELDFGLYSGLSIQEAGKSKYITLLDETAKRVFVFDIKGGLLPNFPVYGDSAPDLGHLKRNANLGFVVKGESDSVLIYRIN